MEEEEPNPDHKACIKRDIAVVREAVKEGKEKEVEVVESGGEDEDEDKEKNEKKN